jgi:transposase
MGNFVTAERDQLFLLPPDARDWLPAGHLAWAVLEQAGRMDLAPFIGWYRADGQGQRAYHPRLMVALVVYCYCKGVRSSRAVEMASYDDVGARVICGNHHPDHATVARFVSRHEQALKGLLVQSLVACAAQGLVSVDVVAGDGTKVKASASMAANATAEQLEIEIDELEALLAAEVDSWFAQAQAAEAEDGWFGEGGEDGGAGGGPATLARLTDKIVRRRKAKARLDEEDKARREQAGAGRGDKLTRARERMARAERRVAQEEAACQARLDNYRRRAAGKAAAGSRKRPDGRVPVAPDDSAHVRRARRDAEQARQAMAEAAAPAPARGRGRGDPAPKANTTDPASRVMPAKKGGFDQLHNVQVLAGARQVIYAIGTHDNPNDTGALHPLLKQGRANLDAAGIGGRIGKALFDAGYASDTNFTSPCEADLYVAVTREACQTGRDRQRRKPESMKASWQQMAARLDTAEGKAIYRQRSAIIEPVFAQLFHRLGRHLNYRDTKTDLELHLWAVSHNLLKAIRAQAQTISPHPAPAPAA